MKNTIQYICAKEEECEIIVTNDKTFYQGEIKVLNSIDFIEKYL